MDNCLFCIFSYLPLNHLAHCFSTCKQYNDVINTTLWRKLLQADYQYNENNCDYRKTYKQHHTLNKFLISQCPDGLISNGKLVKHDIFFLKTTTHLGLAGRKLSYIPPEIELLTNLFSLFARNNKIESLPNELYSLTQLNRLILSLNNIQTVSSEIGLLTNLSDLSLSENQLQEIPNTIGLLTNLSDLDLANNKLQAIPNTMQLLTNLKKLTIQNNQFRTFPKELLNLNLPDMHVKHYDNKWYDKVFYMDKYLVWNALQE